MIEVQKLIEKVLEENGINDCSFVTNFEDSFDNICYLFNMPSGIGSLDIVYPISLPKQAYLIEIEQLKLMIVEQLPLGKYK